MACRLERVAPIRLLRATCVVVVGLLIAGCGENQKPNQDQKQHQNQNQNQKQKQKQLTPVAFDPGLLVGRSFRSEQQLPIHPLDDAPRVPWHVRFDERICTWGYYEVTIIGHYEVQLDGIIRVQFRPQLVREVRAVYDPLEQLLVFDGATYALEKPLEPSAVRRAQANDNPRLGRFVAFLKERGVTIRHDQRGEWRVAAESAGQQPVAVQLWAFPVWTSHQQMQSTLSAGDSSSILFNIASGLAMSKPSYRDAAGNEVPIDRHDDERAEQLESWFRQYESPDIPQLYWLGRDVREASSQPDSQSVLALMNHFREHNFQLTYDAQRDEWHDARAASENIRVVLRSFPKTAGEHQMRCWASSMNLAFLINPRHQLAMSYPPDTARGQQLKQLFLDY